MVARRLLPSVASLRRRRTAAWPCSSRTRPAARASGLARIVVRIFHLACDDARRDEANAESLRKMNQDCGAHRWSKRRNGLPRDTQSFLTERGVKPLRNCEVLVDTALFLIRVKLRERGVPRSTVLLRPPVAQQPRQFTGIRGVQLRSLRYREPRTPRRQQRVRCAMVGGPSVRPHQCFGARRCGRCNRPGLRAHTRAQVYASVSRGTCRVPQVRAPSSPWTPICGLNERHSSGFAEHTYGHRPSNGRCCVAN
jgi:hypothetical protein